MTAHHEKMTLANKVTILRILGIPVFILLLIYYKMSLSVGTPNEYYRSAAATLFLLIALTDALDGYIARTRNQISNLGRILDPIADKTLLVSGVILLTRPGLPELQPQLPVAFSLVVISRDAILIAGAFLLRHLAGEVHISPRLSGKIATTLQMSTIIWCLLAWDPDIFLGLVWAAGALTLLSGILYIVDGAKQLEAAAHGPVGPTKI